jgi:hypothetical protein
MRRIGGVQCRLPCSEFVSQVRHGGRFSLLSEGTNPGPNDYLGDCVLAEPSAHWIYRNRVGVSSTDEVFSPWKFSEMGDSPARCGWVNPSNFGQSVWRAKQAMPRHHIDDTGSPFSPLGNCTRWM